jgi:release factor glutamine methyltransferase
VIRRLAVEAPEFLAPGGSFILEVGAGQAGRIAGLLEASGGYDDVRVVKDLAGIRRVVLGRGKPQGIACRRNRARYNKK